MTESSFKNVEAHLQELYQQGDYTGAYQLASQAASKFTEPAHLVYYWRICMAARIGQDTLSLQLLNEVLTSGFWYGEALLRKSPSLKSLQGNKQFESLVAKNNTLQRETEVGQYPIITLRDQRRCQPGAEPCSLLIALHANASTALASLNFWKPAAQAGWLAAVPQSSQAIWKGAYVWNDPEITEQEIQKHYHILVGQYEINPQQTVLSGHSMGGEMALWLSLKGSIPVQGVVALGPSGPRMDDLDAWIDLLSEPINRSLRIYLAYGENDDTITQANIRAFARLLNQSGITTEFEELPATGNDFSPEYGEALLNGLSFIVSEFISNDDA